MGEEVSAVDLHSLLRRLIVLGAPVYVHEDGSVSLLPLLGFGSMETNGTGFLDIKELNDISRDVQERHTNMHDYKTSETFKNFLRDTCGMNGKRKLYLEKRRLLALGSPTVEIAMLEYEYFTETGETLVPPAQTSVITSIATAGSQEPGEWNVFFDLIMDRSTITETSFSTILLSGVTGRNSHQPNLATIPIKYDEMLRKDQWQAESEALFESLVEQSPVEQRGKTNSIFHYGCISHYDTPAPDGQHKVEGWACHEHWNMLYCIAMARHALEFLCTGGTLVLKVRIFKNLETMGLVSVLSCAFRKVYLYANPRMQAEYVAFVGVGFLGTWNAVYEGEPTENAVVKLVKRVLKASTSYSACDIFDPEIVGNPQFRATLARAHEVREEMRRDHDRVTLVLMQILGLIYKCETPKNISKYLMPRLEELNQGIKVVIDSQWSRSVIKQVIRCRLLLHRTDRKNDKLALDRFVHRFNVESLM
jgi:hypothetical protein